MYLSRFGFPFWRTESEGLGRSPYIPPDGHRMSMLSNWLVLVLLVGLSYCCDAQQVFFVDVHGNDGNPGTQKKPFATLEKAVIAVRDAKRLVRNGSIIVNFRKGYYSFSKTVEFGREDSGSDSLRILYRAFPGEEVHLVGGIKVDGFEPVSDSAILSRIDVVARGKILQLDLKTAGVTDYGKMNERGYGQSYLASGLELFWAGKPMQLARWPNNGWSLVDSVLQNKGERVLRYRGDRPNRWLKSHDIWAHGYWGQDWADGIVKIKAIDTLTKTLTIQSEMYPWDFVSGKRFYVFNILEELDQPGEWYLDRPNGILYVYPPDSIGGNLVYVSLMNRPILSFEGAQNIKIEGLTFEFLRLDAIEINESKNISVEGCTIRNTGTTAIEIKDGENNSVNSSIIYDTGEGGVIMSGGVRVTLTPGKNSISNSRIFRYNRWVTCYRPGVKVAGVGNRIAHNAIYDAPHSGIILHGNEHVVEYNEMWNLCTESSDAGAFYMGRDVTERGNVLRYNYFHDIRGSLIHEGTADVRTIYLDDCASGTTVTCNIFANLDGAIRIGGGRDNLVSNNIFLNCKVPVIVDARGLTWAHQWFDSSGAIMKNLFSTPFTGAVWAAKYPSLSSILNDSPGTPKGNRLVCNVCFGSKWMQIAGQVDSSWFGQSRNVMAQDSNEEWESRSLFRLRSTSQAVRNGFQQIPFERIGINDSRKKVKSN